MRCMFCGIETEIHYCCDSCYPLFDSYADFDYGMLFLGDCTISNLEEAYLASLIVDMAEAPF